MSRRNGRPLVIFVNAQARGGAGASRWSDVERELTRRGIAHEVVMCTSIRHMRDALRLYADGGHREVVAAGGDGTVNALLNAVMEEKVRCRSAEFCLGAIGLGSSNDFHKPFRREKTVAGAPMLVDRSETSVIDVGRAMITDAEGRELVRHFLLNVSLGIVAQGNAAYNRGSVGLKALQLINVELAILGAAFVGLLRAKPVDVSVQLDSDVPLRQTVTNLHILKRVHFAGGMRYDIPVQPDDGEFGVVTWSKTARWRIPAALPRLYLGRFSGHRSADCAKAKRVCLKLAHPEVIELDGEIVSATAATIEILPRSLAVLG
jgi:diacylglycerol kinase (ATP)